MLHVDSSRIGIGNLNRLCDGVPFQRSIAAIPDAAVEKTIFDLWQIPAIKTFKTNVLPHPPGASRNRKPSSSFCNRCRTLFKEEHCSSYNLGSFSKKKSLLLDQLVQPSNLPVELSRSLVLADPCQN